MKRTSKITAYFQKKTKNTEDNDYENENVQSKASTLEVIHTVTHSNESHDPVSITNLNLIEQFIPIKEFIFPKTNGRSCQLKWFDKYSWLHYVNEKDVVLCYPCALACQTKKRKTTLHSQDAFIDIGFQNWKKAIERFSIHEKSENHRSSIEFFQLRENVRPVISLLTEQSLNEQEQARQVFKIVISSIRYLARSGLAIRGGTWDSGNLIYLLQERSLENPAMELWLEKRNNWLSGDIQNEVLEIMAHFILRKIKDYICKSPFMAIMADGTTDVSGQEQFSICFRYVEPISLKINEVFVGMYNPPSADAATLFSCINDLLVRMCLSFENVRGLCFDGAANMSGQISGVQKRISEVQPKSIFIHCSNHALDLALCDTIKTVDLANDTLNLVRFVSITILDSAKRRKMFSDVVLSSSSNDENIHEHQTMPGIISLCPTRWAVRVKAINRFIQNYERIILTVGEILKESNSIAKDRRAGLRGHEIKLWKFETLFSLHSISLIFGPCEQLATALQKPSYTASGAKHASDILIKTLESFRNDSVFDDVWNKTKQQADYLDLELPKPPRTRKVPAKFEYSVTPTPPANIDGKTTLRKEFFALIDCLLQELYRRFTQSGLEKLVFIESILIRTINGENLEKNELTELLSTHVTDFDIDQLQAQLIMLPSILNLNEYTENLMHVVDVFSTLPETTHCLMNQVERLLSLLFTVPATSATPERTFSGLRRLKTYLRSTMSQKRLTHLLLIHLNPNILDEILLDDILKEFISRTAERKCVFGKI